MALEITQAELDRAALVLIGGEDGIYEWSSTKSSDEVAAWLHQVADDIANQQSADDR